MISVMSSVGRPTDVSTITMVTSPAWGMPAAPTLAAVAVMLQVRRVGDTGGKRGQEIRGPGREGHLKLMPKPTQKAK